MVHKNVNHKVGLAVVTGALLVSWFGAGLPALNATLVAPEAYQHAMGLTGVTDADSDGIANKYDASPFGN